MRIEGKPELSKLGVTQEYIHHRNFPLVVLDYHLRMCIRGVRTSQRKCGPQRGLMSKIEMKHTRFNFTILLSKFTAVFHSLLRQLKY